MEVEEIRIGADDPRARLFKDFVEEARKYEMTAAAQKAETAGAEAEEGEEVGEPEKETPTQTYHEMRTLIARAEKAAVATRMITETRPSAEEIAERGRRRTEDSAAKATTGARLDEERTKRESEMHEEEKKVQTERAESAREEVIQRILAARESAKREKKEEKPSLEEAEKVVRKDEEKKQKEKKIRDELDDLFKF